MKAIITRLHVRSYTNQPVGRESIQALLQAAMAAHSEGDERPWHFVVIEDLVTRERIAEIHPSAHMGAGPRRHPDLWRSDAAEARRILGPRLRCGNAEHPG